MGRVPYALSSLAIFFVQPLVTYLALGAPGGLLMRPVFWLNPPHALLHGDHLSIGSNRGQAFFLGSMALVLLVDWLLLSLALRRARRIGGNPSLAVLIILPVIQIAVFLLLTALPDVTPVAPQAGADPRPPSNMGAVALGLMTGAVLCVAAVGLSGIVLHTYGYALFMAAPFVIGITTAYIANRGADLTAGRSTALVMSALTLGALALIGVAFEGVVCLVFASPLIAGMGFLGGLVGRAMAVDGRPSRGGVVFSVALLPLLMLGEKAMPPKAEFESVESIEIAAPPAAVWDSIVHMGPIPDAPAPPFRWGLAYPMRGKIVGGGVGAVREGVFSTGVAYERVTVWEPNHRLFFVVLSDPPTMKELSPYAHVNAPHTEGYFRTADARFTITPLVDGRTRLTLATHHALDLEPALYWMPFAQWAVHANKVRVLSHFRHQAEAATR